MSILRMLRAAASGLVLGFALSGCGSDNPLSSIDDDDQAAVSPPTNLRVSGSLLTWEASPDADVTGYEIEADLADPQVAFVQVGSRTNAFTAFDVSVLADDYVNTWYRVRAVDADGNRSIPSNAVWIASPLSSDVPQPMPDPPVIDVPRTNP